MTTKPLDQTPPALQPLDWEEITTVLLDMDGTLLDKYYDDYFWEHYLPEVYARSRSLAIEPARKELFSRYRSVEKTLKWTDLSYWSEQLGLDIIRHKYELRHLIAVHPHVIDFLEFLNRQNKEVYLITAANRASLKIKMDTVDLSGYFKQLVCAEDIGLAKEDVSFWKRLERRLGFDPERTLFADDTPAVLHAARNFGIRHLLHIAQSSSRKSIHYSSEFTSIAGFDGLLCSARQLMTDYKN
jgi:5'-nucleotidase